MKGGQEDESFELHSFLRMESRSVKMAKHQLYLEELRKKYQANQDTDLGTGC